MKKYSFRVHKTDISALLRIKQMGLTLDDKPQYNEKELNGIIEVAVEFKTDKGYLDFMDGIKKLGFSFRLEV